MSRHYRGIIEVYYTQFEWTFTQPELAMVN